MNNNKENKKMLTLSKIVIIIFVLEVAFKLFQLYMPQEIREVIIQIWPSNGDLEI